MASSKTARVAVLFACLAVFSSQTATAAGNRMLLQTSTSGSCPTIIPGCASGRCSLLVVAGRQQNVCERCVPPFIPSRNGLQCICPPGKYSTTVSGVLTCQPCGFGYFCKGGKQTADNNNAAPEDIGIRQSCYKGQTVDASATQKAVEDKGLTTKTQFAKKYTDCVPMPGWYLNAATEALQEASLCPPLSYSPGYGRIRNCLRCQSGTVENPTGTLFVNSPADLSNSTLKLRVDRFAVCQVPPGRYLVQNVVRACPSGTFRSAYSMVTEPNVKICFSCPPGITTNGTAATSATDCKVVGPGVSITGADLTNAQAAATAAAATGGDSLSVSFNSSLCGYGTYFSGGLVDSTSTGTCQQCPDGSTTQQMGATSVNDCMVPPGYYIKSTAPPGSGGTLTMCPGNVTQGSYFTGFYRAGWLSYQDTTVRASGDGSTVCTKCGDGILSTPRDIDESRGGNDSTALVPASSFSCYMEAGWGMSVTGMVDSATNLMQFNAVLCANNSYGVSERTYGLVSAPCKPCQRNLVTVGPGATNWTQCVNPNGFGYDTSGATPCPEGYYSSAGSLLPCTKCPPGRTTLADPAKQISITNCIVADGNGLFDGDWDIPTTLTPQQYANLTALPCPIGYYGADTTTGSTVNATCTKCPNSKFTRQEGSKLADCNVCQPGYGLSGSDSTLACTICPAGTWSDGTTACKDCPSTPFIYISSKKKEEQFNSTKYTIRQGATGPEECVPQTQQTGIDIGQKLLDSRVYASAESDGSWNTSTGPTMVQCLSRCSASQCCFAEFRYGYTNTGAASVNTCYINKLDVDTNAASAWTTGSGPLVFTKLVFADFIAAASVKDGETGNTVAQSTPGEPVRAKAMSSGLYARCSITASIAYYGKPITGQLYTVQDPASLQVCKSKCDAMSICWGFTVTTVNSGQTSSRVCQLVSGEDQLNTRSFFSNPSADSWSSLGGSLNWY